MTDFAMRSRVFIMTLAALALVAGLSTFMSMSRREDPEMTTRTALVSCQWPGAQAIKVDELIVDVLEGAINRVSEVKEIRSTSGVGSAVIKVELDDSIVETDQVWDELRNEVSAVRGQLPSGASVPFVNSNFGDVSALCLSMFQVPPPGGDGTMDAKVYTDRELEVFAEMIEDELETIESVSGVSIYGLADERIYLEVKSADWSKLGVSAQQLQAALDDRNIVVSSGQIETGGGRFVLRSTGEFESIEELGGVVVGNTPDGRPLLLRDLPITVRRGIEDPISSRVRFADATRRCPRAVLLGVEMKDGSNVVKMGESVEAKLAELRSHRLPPDIDFAIVNNLPRQVDDLVWGFVNNLWQSIVVVLAVALLMMGWRPATVIAAAVPLCMISAIAVVPMFGVELEQFSIASLIIALGMIVDNAIVVSDQASLLLAQGETRFQAALRGAKDLAIPILTSTLTTIAAFVPLLTIVGGTGEYIRSLPIVVSATLIASYFIAMTITPILCYWMLRPGKKDAKKAEGPLVRVYGRLIKLCLRFKAITLIAAFAGVMGSVSLVPLIGNQFFPGGERDQFFIHVRLPHGSTVAQTNAIVEQIEALVIETAEVVGEEDAESRLRNVYSYLGAGGPRLMMTMDPEDPSTRYAFMVVNTTDPKISTAWAAELRERVASIPGARIDVRPYVLGPPLDQPVEYRLTGDDPAVLRAAGNEMVRALRGEPGTLEPYHGWGNSAYEIEVGIDDQRVELAGLSNRSVAQSLNGLIAGIQLTDYREGDYSVPVVLRLAAEERSDLAVLDRIYVGDGAQKVPLDSVATVTTGWQPATMTRFNRSRSITAGSQVADGFLATQVSASVRPKMEAIAASLPVGYRIQEAGEQQESAESQQSMGGALLYSMALIILVLVAQYNSLAKPLVVLSAVPLALIGALLGLLITGWPLGFMPMLGIVALAGVVINNSIILIDFIQGQVASGVELTEAVETAGKVRMKPILLTTLTTVGGMLPLALFGGPMWAGMAYAMIFGLACSTALTLLVIPTIYVAFATWFKMKVVQAP